MFRQKEPILAWRVEDDEQTWQKLTAQGHRLATAGDANEPDKQSKNTRHRFLLAMVFALVLVSLLGAYLHHQARTGLAQVESELEAAVETEGWAASSTSQAILKDVLDPAGSAAWRNRMLMEHEQVGVQGAGATPPPDVRPLLFQDGLALVEVREQPAGGPVYVAHRFYRETEEGWVRTAPRPALWGPSRSHETRFFQFFFRQRDTATVEAVAAEIDDLYTALRTDLGLSAPDAAEKLSVFVTVAESPEFDMLRTQFVQNRLEVPSPALLAVLETATPAQALRQTLHQAVVHDLFQEVHDRYSIRRKWHPLLQGVRLWQLQQADPNPAWHRESLRWLYTEWPAIRRGDRAPAADEANWLCEVYTRGTPLLANRLLPGPCSDAEPAQLLQKMPLPPRRLDDLEMEPGIPADQEHWVHHWQRRALLASVVGYGVEAYGQESLPVLLRAMADHDTWETLIPAVYGVSAQEFEAGWLAYLTR